jgi:RNA polymerase sigma-70 factor (ECF subfamily)
MGEVLAGSRPELAQGLEERFEAFLPVHRERARRLAWRLVGGDAAAAEDVAQEAFVRAWRALPHFRGEARLETWFYRILVRQAARHRRWRAVRERFASARDPAEAAAPQAGGDPGLRRRIGAALSSLSARQREAFVLVHLEGFTVGEAAAVMRCREGTLKSHLHRALVALRAALADLGPASEGGKP